VGGERIEFLPEDVYRFLGQDVGVRSNARHWLEYLRSMYGRFYLAAGDAFRDQRSARDDHRHTIEITDDLEHSNELLFNDRYYLYRFSSAGTYSRLWWQDLRVAGSPQSSVLEFYDPLTFVGGATLRTISLLLKDYRLLHAGAVSLNGQGIILPAAPGMGKSTLVVKLVMLGCRFLSDEIACLHPARGVLEPFPRKVNIREPSQDLLGLSLGEASSPYPGAPGGWQWSMDIEDIRPGSLSSRCKPRYMIFLRGFGDEPRLDAIASSNALFEVLRYAVGPVESPARFLFELAGLLNDMECYHLVIGDVDQTAELVMELAGRARGPEA
jgi:hypothetical protein